MNKQSKKIGTLNTKIEETVEHNCSNCTWLIKGRLCKKLSVLINERDMQGNLKCRYYANAQENS